MTRRTLYGIGAAVVLALVLGFAAMPGEGEAGPAIEAGTFRVSRGTLPIVLQETGTLKTKKSESVETEFDGSAQIAWLVDEGADVTKSAVVVELDKSDVKKQIEDLEARRIQGESELAAARTELSIQETQNKTDVEKAELRLEVAAVNLKKLVEGDIPKEQRTRKLKVDKCRSILERAEEKAKTMPGLLDLGFVTRSQVEEERLKVEEASVELDAAIQELDLYERFQRPIDLKTKGAEVTEAERELGRARQRAESHRHQKQAHVQMRELALKKTNDQLEEAQKKLTQMTLRAPTAGIVVYGDPDDEWRNQEVKVGAQVWQGRTILTIPDTSEFAVKLHVHEADVEKLKVGMRASIVVETRKDVPLTGEVTKIASVASAGGWRDAGVKKFAVDVAVQERNLTLRPGVTAKAEIRVGSLADVIHVPVQAVRARDGKQYCHVREGGREVARAIEIGGSNDKFVEVKRGLAEGDLVLLYDPEIGDRPVAPSAEPAGDGGATGAAGSGKKAKAAP